MQKEPLVSAESYYSKFWITYMNFLSAKFFNWEVWAIEKVFCAKVKIQYYLTTVNKTWRGSEQTKLTESPIVITLWNRKQSPNQMKILLLFSNFQALKTFYANTSFEQPYQAHYLPTLGFSELRNLLRANGAGFIDFPLRLQNLPPPHSLPNHF